MAQRQFAIRGDIDLATSQDLQRNLLALVNASNDDLALDCSEMTFIDSSGIAVFVHTQRLLEINGRDLRLRNVSRQARRALDLLGLSEMLGLPVAEPAS